MALNKKLTLLNFMLYNLPRWMCVIGLACKVSAHFKVAVRLIFMMDFSYLFLLRNLRSHLSIFKSSWVLIDLNQELDF